MVRLDLPRARRTPANLASMSFGGLSLAAKSRPGALLFQFAVVRRNRRPEAAGTGQRNLTFSSTLDRM